MTKQKLLFLSAHLPSPDASEAGQVCAFRNLEILAEKYEIQFVAFRNRISRNWPSAPVEKLCGSVRLFEVTHLSRMLSALRNIRLPLMAAARGSNECKIYIQSLAKSQRFVRVHLEGQQMAIFAAEYDAIPRKTLYAQDVFSQTFERKAKEYRFPRSVFYAIELGRLRRWEHEVFSAMTELYVPSEKDVALISAMDKALAPKTKAVNLYFKQYSARNSIPHGCVTLIYWGAYSRPENVDAAEFLINDIFPLLKIPGRPIRIVIAGANPPRSFNNFDRENVSVTGFIEKPGDTLRSATIAVLPLRMGGGVKVKVLELLSAGVPVVTTSVGGEGIPCPAESGLVVTSDLDAKSIAEAVQRLLSQSPEKLMGLSNAAANWSRNYAASGNTEILI